MGFGNHGPINTGLPPSESVICEPVPAPSILTCRRGHGSRTFQGQKPPTCDGLVKPYGQILACEKCKLTHAIVIKDGVAHYGTVL